MLEKIICIDNVGVIKKGAPKAVDLEKVALVYADNARGKSTLSALLLACADADAQQVIDRKTVGATTPQKVVLRFNPADSSGAFNAEFNGVWTGPVPNLHVFNQAFVERNVFASSGVLPEHRQALLTLALGDAAVKERAKFEAQSVLQTTCAEKVRTTEGALQGFTGTYTVDQFMALAELPNVEASLAEIDKTISEARAADQIASRPVFRKLTVPDTNLDGFVQVFKSSFATSALEAERLARAHFAKHTGGSTERWVAAGLEHKPEEDCPFCGQDTTGLKLLEAYRAYFNESYRNHMKTVADLGRAVSSTLDRSEPRPWRQSADFNLGLQGAWAESIDLKAAPFLDVEKAETLLAGVRERLSELVLQKEAAPLEAIDAAPIREAQAALDEIAAIALKYNARVDEINRMIDAYKAKFAKPDVTLMISQRADLMVRKSRFEPAPLLLISEVVTARANFKAAEAAKDAARKDLDKLMDATLASFQQAINDWLGKFGAPFLLDKLTHTYKGGGLRSEYVLKVRGATVVVGPSGSGPMSFHAALSEGDKRTLAFAFFLAQLFADPTKSNATVVLDDVFTSLDRHRRHNTVEAVLKMIAECAQVIALGHDAHFLREVKKRVSKKKVAVSELVLERDAADYSFIGAFDLDEYCSSDYYKHYTLVEKFVNAESKGSLLEVAKALRLLVEGHMHRCFPKKFAEGQTVGDMLAQVKSAALPSPLVKLQPLHADLVTFNEFAAQFHHDTSGGYTRVEVNEAELLPFAKSALGFIQIRSLK